MWHLWILLFVSLSFAASCEAQFDNVRCKCICPADPERSREVNIQVVTVSLPEECSCEQVMKRNESDCLRCECKYESRNIMTIEVVVFLIMGVIMCLFLYTVLLLIMDPQIFKSKLSEPQAEEEFTTDVTARTGQPLSYFHRVGNAQRRWRSQVQQQRENIFDRHTILS
ncbi:transmembrane protein 9B-like [Diadema setosum]|uniref:transmembrane protein 9B-like n=1 Tax=Diadema setosum TaxID=31175 RepID=UPI003B3AD8B9